MIDLKVMNHEKKKFPSRFTEKEKSPITRHLKSKGEPQELTFARFGYLKHFMAKEVVCAIIFLRFSSSAAIP